MLRLYGLSLSEQIVWTELSFDVAKLIVIAFKRLSEDVRGKDRF